jgi:hypothetical protein
MLDSLFVGDFNRRYVLVIGDKPLNEVPFIERNLKIINTTVEDASNHFKFSKAILVSADPSLHELILNCFENLFPVADNYGITHRVLIEKETEFTEIMTLTKGADLNEFHFYQNIIELAETIARYSPGPPENDIAIEGDRSGLSPEVKLLLRRSFYDCERIHIKKLGGGKDAEALFKVFAWMKNSEVGPLPMPFFAKISKPDKIDRELLNYRVYTDLYISFQYRPNCRIERCVRTSNFKSLVGDFVDDSILLRAALKDIHHSGIIFSLFERSLKSFRIQPFVARRMPATGDLANFIDERVWLDQLKSRTDVIERAKAYGLKTEVENLHNLLLRVCPPSCIIGPIHGDLNSRNVMVRGNDAILIDFSAIKPNGPLTADPVNLEVSLCFELDENEKLLPFDAWRVLIDELYIPDKLLQPPALSEGVPTEFSWLRRAVREIRHILTGCDCCNDEIKAIVACYLLRAVRLAPEEIHNEKDKLEFEYRAYALVVAERIILSLQPK